MDLWGEDDGERGVGGLLVESAHRGDVEGEGRAVVNAVLLKLSRLDIDRLAGILCMHGILVYKVLHRSLIRLAFDLFVFLRSSSIRSPSDRMAPSTDALRPIQLLDSPIQFRRFIPHLE